MIDIDWSIKPSEVLVIGSFIGTIGMYMFKAGRVAAAIDRMQQEIIALKDVAKTVTEVLTNLAIQKTELAFIREDIHELKHGRGFIK